MPNLPDCGLEDHEVEVSEFDYSDRDSTDWVSSGPLSDFPATGRRFATWEAAERWAKAFYGARFRGPVPELASTGKWGFYIKGPRGAIGY